MLLLNAMELYNNNLEENEQSNSVLINAEFDNSFSSDLLINSIAFKRIILTPSTSLGILP